MEEWSGDVHTPRGRWIVGLMTEPDSLNGSGIHQFTAPTIWFGSWPPRLVSRQRLLGFSEALICLSYSGDWLAEPKLGERRLVVPRGNAPRSLAYQASALLLS